VSVIVHKDGHRELYVFEDSGEQPTAVISITLEQARLLGAVLSGTYITS
jgi:K+/H+ antiporter YhaU regulatory subunit KhtT